MSAFQIAKIQFDITSEFKFPHFTIDRKYFILKYSYQSHAFPSYRSPDYQRTNTPYILMENYLPYDNPVYQ